jgi:hypothetical protein
MKKVLTLIALFLAFNTAKSIQPHNIALETHSHLKIANTSTRGKNIAIVYEQQVIGLFIKNAYHIKNTPRLSLSPPLLKFFADILPYPSYLKYFKSELCTRFLTLLNAPFTKLIDRAVPVCSGLKPNIYSLYL